MEVLTAIFCLSPNLEILSARGGGADKKSKFGLGRRAVCHGFLEAHNPKSPKKGLGGVARGHTLSKNYESRVGKTSVKPHILRFYGVHVGS